MPMRAFRCRACGHEFEMYLRMDESGPSYCAEEREDGTGRCLAELEPQIQSTQRPIVRSGTRIHHQRLPEGTV